MTNQTPAVRLEVNGEYWRAVWRSPSTRKKQSQGLGARAQVTKRDALGLCREIQTQLANDPTVLDAGRAPSLDRWQSRYFEIQSKLKDESAADQAITFGLLIEFFGADCRLDEIDTASATDFRLSLEKRRRGTGEKSRPISVATVRKHVRNCKTIWSVAIEQRVARSSPWRHENSTVPSVAQNWAKITREDLERLLTACEGPQAAQFRSLFALCRLAGFRAGEALRLRWAEIDWQTKIALILPDVIDGERREGTKQRERAVPLCPRLVEVLAESRQNGLVGPCAGLSYGGHLHAALDPIIARAGLVRYAKPLHTLRKCLETEWMQTNPVMVVCTWLGNSPEVARRHYVRPEQADIDRIVGGPQATPAARIAQLKAELAVLEGQIQA